MFFTDSPMPAFRRRRHTRDDDLGAQIAQALQPFVERLDAVESAIVLLADGNPDDPDADLVEATMEPTDDEGIDDKRLLSNAKGAADLGNLDPAKGDTHDTKRPHVIAHLVKPGRTVDSARVYAHMARDTAAAIRTIQARNDAAYHRDGGV